MGTDEDQAFHDAAIEVEIDIAWFQFASAQTRAQRKRAHDKFEQALKSRSPQTVRRMEREKGLRR
ncbi:MAG: hypothetical protein U9Q81_27000 [Pseudomonadota bacterium]|nr:hypothetical protein [Pseudomonadota bacterium]